MDIERKPAQKNKTSKPKSQNESNADKKKATTSATQSRSKSSANIVGEKHILPATRSRSKNTRDLIEVITADSSRVNDNKESKPLKSQRKRKNEEISNVDKTQNESEFQPERPVKTFTISQKANKEKRIIKWNLINRDVACRYTSFLTLFRFKLIYIHQSLGEISSKEGGEWFNKLLEVNETLHENKYEAIEDFASYNHNNKHEMDEYGVIGCIIPLFAVFRNIDICRLETQDSKTCSTCFHIVSLRQKIGPLFSFNDSTLSRQGIEQSLIETLSPRPWTCECCSRTSDDISTREIISVPSLLFIVLDLPYSRIKNFTDYKLTLEIIDLRYELCAAITKPQANHFALLVKDPQESDECENYLGWYRFDNTSNKGDIVPLNYRIETALKKYYGYVLIYKRVI